MLNGIIHHSDARNKSSMAGAIRLAVSRALLAFIDEEKAEQMRRGDIGKNCCNILFHNIFNVVLTVLT